LSGKKLILLILIVVPILAVTSCAKYESTGTQSVPYRYSAEGGLKHIIIFIGDGMSLSSETAASRYMFGNDSGLVWNSFPVQTFVSTWDIDTYNLYAKKSGSDKYDPEKFYPLTGYDPSKGGDKPYPICKKDNSAYFLTPLTDFTTGCSSVPATDSASSATAIFTGQKTDSGNISWASGDHADGVLETIAEKMRRQKKASIGAVTTVPFSHATPAAFLCHNTDRGNYTKDDKNIDSIARQIIINTKPDVVIGGGHPLFCANKYITDELYSFLLNSEEYIFVQTIQGENASVALLDRAKEAVLKRKKLFGLFGENTDGSIGQFVPQPLSPSIAKKSKLSPSLKDSVIAALTVLSSDPDGFILMAEQGDIDWANHNNDFQWMIGSVLSLNEAVKATVDFVDKPGDNIDWTNTLIIVTADHANGYLRFGKIPLKQGELPIRVKSSDSFVYTESEIKYYLHDHTNEPVGLYAIGYGADLIREYEGLWYKNTAIIDNTHIFRILKKAANLN